MPDETLALRYERLCADRSDINEHLPTLYRYAKECSHITEFGTREGISTTAFLYAQPAKLICYDIIHTKDVDILNEFRGITEFVFYNKDVLTVKIEPTDLLFIDSKHTYYQMENELRLHAEKARKYIIMHDTTICESCDEGGVGRGIWLPIVEFLKQGTFKIKERFENNCGLTVLERV